MSIFDYFSSKEKRAKLSHLKNLIVLSMADGKVEKSELAAIAAVCNREGITDSDFKRCLENPESIDFVAPADDNTRLRYLKDMVLLMMSDGNIDDNEIVVCKLTAEALGFKHEVIDALVLDIIAQLSEELKKAK
jgi:uncharacterized tellurite resistance protein B-like protein